MLQTLVYNTDFPKRLVENLVPSGLQPKGVEVGVCNPCYLLGAQTLILIYGG